MRRLHFIDFRPLFVYIIVMLEVITHPNPILKKQSQVVTNISSTEIQALIPEMIETMHEKDGVGLAAPQIGKNIRMLVINHCDNELIIFNPNIKKKSFLKEWGEEGCLSVPGKYGDVKRHRSVTMDFLDKNGNRQIIKAKGLLARILQHEIDHLDGILFIEKAKKIHDIEPTLDA